MGIQGLLPLLKTTTATVHIKEYSGKIAAVDTYSWLHKGAITCSRELCQGLPTTKFVDYCMHRVNLLRQYGVRPLLVFDGGRLPMKEEQEIKRARSRKVNFERAEEHEQSGNTAAAYDYYQKAVDITPQIAFQLVKVLQEEHIPYIVAPYEADAQLAFLSIQGHADVIITEDSDAIPFGCAKVLFKMDKFGQGVEFQYNDLAKNRDLNFTSFTKQMILEMCILSGCDYLPSLQGMGIKRAHGLMRRFRNYQKVIKHLKYNGVSVPSSYENMFAKAIATFQHQPVYDPVLEDIVPLTPLPLESSQSLTFLGEYPFDHGYDMLRSFLQFRSPIAKLGQAIARGEVDPISKMPFELKSSSLKAKNASPIRQRKRQLDLPIQKNLLTSYFLSASTEAKRQFKAPRTSELETVSLELRDDFESLDVTFAKTLECRAQKIPPALHCRASDFSFSLEEEDQVLDFLNSKMVCANLPMSAEVDIQESASCKMIETSFTGKSRIQKSGGKCVVRSIYFSKNKVAEKPLRSLDAEPSTSDNAFVDEGPSDVPSSDSCKVRNPDVDFSDGFPTPVKKHDQGTIDKGARLQVKQGSKLVDHISIAEKKHTPNFSSKLLGDNGQPQKFASDTSHIEHYATIAQKSMERFVSTIAPFRCFAPGARASGLRRPTKPGGNGNANRLPFKASKVAEDLRQFAFTPSCRSSLAEKAVLGVKSVARLNEYLHSECD
ncbi:hypothetical protein GOP47_0005497 [Adiantum capillus-veneris]|uniref:Exonuclease 1 n=1 Tax=Adiantum capillus-veneris TaxID=13818 RepID=A0A9D4ZLF7_ADICA|nr:hypothetical protein GOP47_0005497 [Adiantum capillus-veneris]